MYFFLVKIESNKVKWNVISPKNVRVYFSKILIYAWNGPIAWAPTTKNVSYIFIRETSFKSGKTESFEMQ